MNSFQHRPFSGSFLPLRKLLAFLLFGTTQKLRGALGCPHLAAEEALYDTTWQLVVDGVAVVVVVIAALPILLGHRSNMSHMVISELLPGTFIALMSLLLQFLKTSNCDLVKKKEESASSSIAEKGASKLTEFRTHSNVLLDAVDLTYNDSALITEHSNPETT